MSQEPQKFLSMRSLAHCHEPKRETRQFEFQHILVQQCSGQAHQTVVQEGLALIVVQESGR